MQRLVWLALFCLAAVVSLVVIRPIVVSSSPTRAAASSAAVAGNVQEVAAPLAKADRLPSRFLDNGLSKTPVETVRIIPSVPPKKSTSSKDDIVAWHWHEGMKVVRRRKSP